MCSAHIHIVAILSLLFAACHAAPWTAEQYPNPSVNVTKCGRNGVRSWVCDPDGVVSYAEANIVEGLIKEIEAGQHPYVRHKCGAAGLEGYQVAVALMKEFALEEGRSVDEEAAFFAKELHDRWGVGDAACNNGIVLLLSVDNRRVYISTGRAAAKHVHNQELEIIIGNMKPFLKEGRYGKAVEQALAELGLALAGHQPKDSSSTGAGFFVIVVGAFASLVGWSAWSGWKQRKRYQSCRDKLEKIKRDQAAARSQDYASSSCPICLEDFSSTTPASPQGGLATGGCNPSCTGLRDRRKAGASKEGGEETEQLLTQQEAAAAAASSASASGAGCSSAGATPVPPAAGGKAGGSWSSNKGPGAQRKPLYLPCGHSFCEPCIAEWVKTHSTCPICRKDITQDDSNQPPQAANLAQESARQRQQQQQYQYQYYQPELLFRLSSLRRQYPWYVTGDMYDTWSGDIREQRELNTERLLAFQLNDPALQQQRESSGRQGTSSSFGGGRSGGGGGAGGSW